LGRDLLTRVLHGGRVSLAGLAGVGLALAALTRFLARGRRPAWLATRTAWIAGAGLALAGSGERETDGRQEISAVLNAKTSLVQAIAIAERKIGGKAVETGFENRDGAMAYEIKIAKGNRIQTVLVALDTGKIITVTATRTDRDEDEGGEGHSD